jgi:hypothetical protein
VTDDTESFKRRCGLIDEIEATALEGAKDAPRSAWAREKLESIIEAAHAGRLVLSPQAKAIARRIGEIADRIARERGWSR